VLALAFGAVLLLGGTACGDSKPPSQFADAHAGLCRAAASAAAGRGVDAQRTFFDQSHADLHTLAAEVESRDRAAASRLLTAKQEAEAGPWDQGDTSARRALTLAAATRDAIGVLGEPKPRPCKDDL
jgi:hypothetical protein